MKVQPHGVPKGRAGRGSRRWMTFVTGDPGDRFMLWTRRALLVFWAGLLVVQVPSLAQRAHQIFGSIAPGAERSAAIRGLVFEAIAILIVVPLFLFAVIGYGIAVRSAPAVWSTGGPWFRAWWRPRRRQKQSPRRPQQ